MESQRSPSLKERALTARSTVWTTRAFRLAIVGAFVWCAYAAAVIAWGGGLISTVPLLDAALALVLGMLLAVRTNRAYERWWEGRTLWGSLVNSSRNLAIEIKVYGEPNEEESAWVHQLIAGFAYGLRDHLRMGASLRKVPGFEETEDDPDHVPVYFVGRLHELFRAWRKEGRFTGHELRMLHLEVRVLLEVCGACERIKTTALPPSLTWITRIAIGVALLAMPWFLGDELGEGVILAGGVGAFFLLISETIASALEHPFGVEHDQLDLSVIARVIDVTTAEALGVCRYGGDGAGEEAEE